MSAAERCVDVVTPAGNTARVRVAGEVSPEAEAAIAAIIDAAVQLAAADKIDPPTATRPYPSCGRCKGTGVAGGWQGACPQCGGRA